MKKLMIIFGTGLIAATIFAISVSASPVKENDAQPSSYLVKRFTIKPEYKWVPCPDTGFPVPNEINMDPSEIGPCDCRHYYNTGVLTYSPIIGFKCVIFPGIED